jgi:hypothetical protein
VSRKSNATLLGEIYDAALVRARAAAHGCGYALAVHGSEMRDFDLIAVPWAEGAKSGEELIDAIVGAVGGTVNAPPTKKPHGRFAVSIFLGDTIGNFKPIHPYLDVSVVPWLPQAEETG